MTIKIKNQVFVILCVINAFVIGWNIFYTREKIKVSSLIINNLIDANIDLLKCTESINNARILIGNYKNEKDTIASILIKDNDFMHKYDSLKQDARINLKKSKRIYENIFKGKINIKSNKQ